MTTYAAVLVAARALAPADVAPLVEAARAARGVFAACELVVVTAGPLSPELIALALASAGLDRDVEVVRGGAALGERQRAGLRLALARDAEVIATLTSASWARAAAALAGDLRALAAALEAADADAALGVAEGSPLLGRVIGALTGAPPGDLLGAGPRLWRRRALARVAIDALSGGAAFELELALALFERDVRLTTATAALARRPGPLADPRGALALAAGAARAGARAALARLRNRLAFPGPPDLPRSPAPSVSARGRRRRSLPVVSSGEESRGEEESLSRP